MLTPMCHKTANSSAPMHIGCHRRVMEKRCGRCGAARPIQQFHRWKRGDGFQPWCKACRKAYDAAYNRRTLARRRERRAERKREFVA